jgi:hypothetical protein
VVNQELYIDSRVVLPDTGEFGDKKIFRYGNRVFTGK